MLAGACQFGHGVGGFAINLIHSSKKGDIMGFTTPIFFLVALTHQSTFRARGAELPASRSARTPKRSSRLNVARANFVYFFIIKTQ